MAQHTRELHARNLQILTQGEPREDLWVTLGWSERQFRNWLAKSRLYTTAMKLEQLRNWRFAPLFDITGRNIEFNEWHAIAAIIYTRGEEQPGCGQWLDERTRVTEKCVTLSLLRNNACANHMWNNHATKCLYHKSNLHADAILNKSVKDQRKYDLEMSYHLSQTQESIGIPDITNNSRVVISNEAAVISVINRGQASIRPAGHRMLFPMLGSATQNKSLITLEVERSVLPPFDIDENVHFEDITLTPEHLFEARVAITANKQFKFEGHVMSPNEGELPFQFALRLARVRLQFSKHNKVLEYWLEGVHNGRQFWSAPSVGLEEMDIVATFGDWCHYQFQ